MPFVNQTTESRCSNWHRDLFINRWRLILIPTLVSKVGIIFLKVRRVFREKQFVSKDPKHAEFIF